MLFALAVLLNDSSVIAQGGTVTSYDGLTFVQMVSEEINVDMGTQVVTANFKFTNTGGATGVTMGFPEEGYGDTIAPTAENPTGFKSFKSWVDGQEVKCTRMPSSTMEDGMYKQWWVKTVGFATGQTRTVKCVYQTRYGGNTEDQSWITYVLESGAPWYENIGSAKISFDLTKLPAGTLVGTNQSGVKRQGNKLVWMKSNFEPTADDNITVVFLDKTHREGSDRTLRQMYTYTFIR